MKTILKLIVLVVFAFQATGASLPAHMASCRDQGSCAGGCSCAAGCCDCAAADAAGKACPACQNQKPIPAKPAPCRHDPQKCPICQLLLSLAATPAAPLALPSLDQVVIQPPAQFPAPAQGISIGPSDARAPPSSSL